MVLFAINQEFIMSEASRAAALQHAAMVHQGSGDPVATLETAEAFHAFISAGQDAAPAKAAPAKAAPAKPAAKTPAKAAPPVEPDPDEVTKDQMGESIAALIEADMRKQAVALLLKFKAKSVSEVAAENYAAVKQAADDLLMSA